MKVALAILARLKKVSEYYYHKEEGAGIDQAIDIVEQEIGKAQNEVSEFLKRPPRELTREQATIIARIPGAPEDVTVFPVKGAFCVHCKKSSDCLKIIVSSTEHDGCYDTFYTCELCYGILLKEGRLNLKMKKPQTQTKEE